MSQPLVSVVMPVRNGGELIRDAARSILHQTLSDLELVVVDDCSPEETKGILRRLQAEDQRVVLLTSDGAAVGGIAQALNAGFRLARGRYLARMDADDVSLPRRLEQQVALLEREPDIGLVGGQMIATDLSGARLWRTTYPPDDATIRRELGVENPFGHPTVVMRREPFDACGGYREVCLRAEDYELWMRMLDHCRGANVREPVLLYRVHPDQTAFHDWRQQCLSTLAVQAAVRIRRQQGRDPLDDTELVTDGTLRELSVPELAIRTRFVESLLALSSLAGHTGSDPERRRLLAQARAEAGNGPIPRAALARLALVEALAAFERRAYAIGVARLVISLRADPRAVTALAVDRLYRRHRWLFMVLDGARKLGRLLRPARRPRLGR